MIHQEKPKLFDVAQKFSQNLEIAQKERGEHEIIFSRALHHKNQWIKDHPFRSLLIGVTIGLAITGGIKGVRNYKAA